MDIFVPSGWKLRDGQLFAIEKILKAFETKPVVAIQAPTGSGKSLIGRTVSKHFSSSYLLTPLKALQDQYWSDFNSDSTIALLKGKSNYNCSVFKDFDEKPISVDRSHCQRASEIDQRNECRELGVCPYYTAKDLAIARPCTIMNFTLYLCWRMVSEKMSEPAFSQRPLHVIDEAHKVEDFCRDFLTISLREDEIGRRLGITSLPPEGSPEESLVQFLGTVGRENTRVLNALVAQYCVGCDYEELRQLALESTEIEREAGFHLDLDDKIRWFSEDKKYGFGRGYHWDEKRKIKIPTFLAKPIYVGGFLRKKVLGERTLLMSATLPKDYVYGMGLSDADFEYIEVPSTFPKENRPIFFTPVGKMNKGNIKELSAAAIPDRISQILEKAGEEKGIIHAPSYDVAEAVHAALADTLWGERLILQERGKGGAQRALEQHTTTDGPTYLITPGMKEGVDLKDDLSRFQVIIKCPYPSLGDPAVAKLVKDNHSWYVARTIMDFMQMYGRSVRSEADWARTYILDGALEEFLWKYRNRIPAYITEAIKWRNNAN